VIGAAVDVGSNSVHLLVAKVTDAGLEPLLDESELLGLGDVVDRDGVIPAESVDTLVRALVSYRDRARALGANTVTFFGTEPLREALNADAVISAVEERTGIPLRVLSPHDEGELTFVGVTGDQPVGDSLLVADIGGGSTEIVSFDPRAGLTVTGLPVGSARLTRDHVKHDPPTDDEIDALRKAAAEACGGLPDAQPSSAIFVGGTATNIVRLAPLATDSFVALYEIVRGASAADLVARYGLRPRRAQQITAGAALAEAVLRRYGLPHADVADASLRDGAIIVAARQANPRAV
jgi:exopolyphosphatase / guanosine-5'-triphosphate,3'-diphosphate pyrophosphatase